MMVKLTLVTIVFMYILGFGVSHLQPTPPNSAMTKKKLQFRSSKPHNSHD